MRKILVANLRKRRIKIRPLKEVVHRVLEGEGVDNVEVSIVLGDDEFIQELNRIWRGVNTPTDVLAFPFGKKGMMDKDYTCLGEIVISIDTATRQARALGHSLNEELKILLIHGALHLLGYDHEREKDASKMRERENGYNDEKVRTYKKL